MSIYEPSPKLKVKTRKEKIISIENLLGGWAEQKSLGGASAKIPVEGSKTQYTVSQAVDMYRQNFVGHMAPGAAWGNGSKLTDAGGKVNQLPVAATSIDTNYAVLANNRVVRFTSMAVDQVNVFDWASSGGVHNTHTAQTTNSQDNDIIAALDVLANPNMAYVFYSWEDNTDGDIGIITKQPLGSPTQTQAWFSSLTGSGVLQAGVPRKLAIGTDGNLYSTNGQYLASADIALDHLSGSVPANFAAAKGYPTRLNLGNGWTAASLTPYQNYMVIVGNKTVDNLNFGSGTIQAQFPTVRVWFWDMAAANPNFVIDIPDFSAGCVYRDKFGSLFLTTSGRDGLTTLYKYDGSVFQKQFSHLTSSVGSPTHSQIDSINDMPHFVGASGYVNQWDDKNTGFHQAQYLGYATAGFLKNLDQPYAGVFIGSNNYGIIPFSDSGGDVTYAINSFLDTVFVQIPYHATITQLKLYFSQFGTDPSARGSSYNSKLKVSLYNDFDTTSDLLALQLDATSLGTLQDFSQPLRLLGMSGFWMKLLWNHGNALGYAAVLRKAEVYYVETEYKL